MYFCITKKTKSITQMESIDDSILKRISTKKVGYIFILNDFSDLANANAVRVAVHRLVQKGVLHRVAPGLFVKPKISKLLNKEVLPNLDDIAQAIARKDEARIIPTGSFAMYKLGLTTQVPLNLVYLTDAKARKIKVGNSCITFKKTTPKKLALKGEISKFAILAMGEIGNGNLTTDETNKIIDLLKKENIEILKHNLRLSPQWIAELIKKGLEK